METIEALQRQARDPMMGDLIRSKETGEEGVILEARAGDQIPYWIVRWASGQQEVTYRHLFEFV